MHTYPFKRILVPTDFSTCSDAALDLAAGLAVDQNAELVVLHVVTTHDLPLTAIVHPPAHPAGISVRDYSEAVARRELDSRLAHLPAALQRRSTLVAFGAAASAILAHADSLAPDLIVMGSHGRSGFSHMLAGSVAEKVIRACLVPVLVVRERTCREQPLDLQLDGEREG